MLYGRLDVTCECQVQTAVLMKTRAFCNVTLFL